MNYRKFVSGTIVFILFLILQTMGCKSNARTSENSSSPEYKRGFDKGIEDAKAEILSGQCTYYVYGLGNRYMMFNADTGLVDKAIAGCIVSDYEIGLTTGHNNYILEHIKKYGSSPGSLLKWADIIKKPDEYFDQHSKEIVYLFSKPLKQPDGKATIVLICNVKGKFSEWDASISTTTGVTRNIRLQGTLACTLASELVWGPKGSNLAFLRYQCRQNTTSVEQTIVVSLVHGECLNIHVSHYSQ